MLHRIIKSEDNMKLHLDTRITQRGSCLLAKTTLTQLGIKSTDHILSGDHSFATVTCVYLDSFGLYYCAHVDSMKMRNTTTVGNPLALVWVNPCEQQQQQQQQIVVASIVLSCC